VFRASGPSVIRVRLDSRLSSLSIRSRRASPPPRETTNVVVIFNIERFYNYIVLGEIWTGSPNDETSWLPNKEMTKPCLYYMREAHARRARPRRSLDRSRRPFLPRPLAPLVRPLGLGGGSAKKWPNRSLYRRVAR